MISAGDFKNGLTIEVEGNVYQIVEFQHVKPGKGAAFVRTKMKNIKNGGVVEKTFRPTEKFPQAHIERKEMQYLYTDGDLYYFMDGETFDQIGLNEDAIVYLKIAAEDLSGSCNPTAYYGYLDLCGDRLYLRLGAGAYQHGGCFAGRGSPDYLLPAKRHYPVGDSISYQPLWPADGGDLATGQSSGFSVLSTRHNLWISCRAPFDEVCKSADQLELLIFF